MFDKSRQRQFDFLCEKLVHEEDSTKIIELVKEINSVLGEEARIFQEERYVHMTAAIRAGVCK